MKLRVPKVEKAILHLAFFFSCLLSLNAGSNSFVGKCVNIVDGDTVDVSRDGTTIRIRMAIAYKKYSPSFINLRLDVYFWAKATTAWR